MNAQVEVTDVSGANEAELDGLLADLDLEADALEASDIVEEEIIEEIDDGALRDLEIDLERAEVYEAQTATETEENVAEAAAPDPSKKKRAAKSTKSSAPAAPRVARNLDDIPAEFFVRTGDVSKMSDADKDAAKAATMALKPGQVKIAEKFENLFQTLAAGKKPSTYVQIAFDLLTKNKTLTSADLIAGYKASGLGEGTARSQTGQIMVLFSVAGIANRSGQVLHLRDDSTVAERLRAILGA